MKVTKEDRERLIYYLNEFYKKFPTERFTIFHYVRFFKLRLRNKMDAWNAISGETGCQPKGSKVMMADGSWKNIEDIRIGDIVLSPQIDGTNIFSKVINLFCFRANNIYDVYHFYKKDKKLYSCSDNHDIPINKRSGKIKKWTIKHFRASELIDKHNDFLKRSPTYTMFSIDKFKDKEDCKIEPYTLGIWLGDGHFFSKKYTKLNPKYQKEKNVFGHWYKFKDKLYWKRGYIRSSGRKEYLNYGCKNIGITTNDFGIIEYISKFYPIMNIRKKDKTKAKSYLFSINSDLSIYLMKYGLEGKGSGEKFIPPSALTSSLEYRKKLLSGLIDSDGYLSKGRSYSITTKSKQLAKDIEFLVYSLGGRADIKKVKKGIKKINFVGEYYCISFYIGYNLPLIIKRKKREHNPFHLTPNRVCIKLNKRDGDEVYGFELDSQSHWYITDNYVITKNSGKSYLAIMAQILFGRRYDLEDNITYIPTGKEIIEKFNKLKFNTLLIDEAAKDLLAVDWQKKSQRKVNVAAMTERFKQNWVLLNLPNFNEFTKSLRTGSILFRCIIAYRTSLYARVIVQRKDRNWRSDDVWYDKKANEQYEKALKRYKEVDNETILRIERNLPNTVMDFIVPNLALILPHITNEYERLKLDSRIKDDELTKEIKGDIYRDKYNELLKKVTKLLYHNELSLGKVRVSKGDMAKSMGVSPQTFNKYLLMSSKTKQSIIQDIHNSPKDVPEI